MALTHDLSSPALRAYGNLTSIVSLRDRNREALELSLKGAELAQKSGR